MNNLIIYAHPNKESLNSEILTSTINVIEERGENIKIIDLYDEKFNPVLIFNNEKRRRDMHLDKECENYREKIIWADTIVFIYPVWWNDVPAILKGFFDRVFASEFAYSIKNMIPHGLLKDKKAVIINTMDAPGFYVKYFLFDDHFRNFKTNILKFCGFEKVKRKTFFAVKHKKRDRLVKEMKEIKNLF